MNECVFFVLLGFQPAYYLFLLLAGHTYLSTAAAVTRKVGIEAGAAANKIQQSYVRAKRGTCQIYYLACFDTNELM